MNIALTGTKVTQDTKFLAFEKNNNVDVINITVDTDESWEYKLDVKYPGKCCTGEALYNIINLTRNGNLCTAILTSDMLPFAGKYIMQLRGISGDKVYHSDVFDTWVKWSVEPGDTYNPVPSEFYQIEQNVTEMNNNPPYPSNDGYWMIWDTATHAYKKSDIKAANGLPEITEDTKDMALYNDGEKAEWRKTSSGIKDWNENEPTSDAYIQNRHGGYYKLSAETVATGQANMSSTTRNVLVFNQDPSIIDVLYLEVVNHETGTKTTYYSNWTTLHSKSNLDLMGFRLNSHYSSGGVYGEWAWSVETNTDAYISISVWIATPIPWPAELLPKATDRNLGVVTATAAPEDENTRYARTSRVMVDSDGALWSQKSCIRLDTFEKGQYLPGADSGQSWIVPTKNDYLIETLGISDQDFPLLMTAVQLGGYNYNSYSMTFSAPTGVSGTFRYGVVSKNIWEVVLHKPDVSASLCVTITRSDDDTYSSDHTYAEIKAAYEAGKYMYALFDGNIVPLGAISDKVAIFSISHLHPNPTPYIEAGGLECFAIQISISSADNVNVNLPDKEVFAIPQQFIIDVTKNESGVYSANVIASMMEDMFQTFMAASGGVGMPNFVAVLLGELYRLTSISQDMTSFVFTCEGEITKILTCTAGDDGDTWTYKEVVTPKPDTKTDAQTQPVGMDVNGKLWTAPPSSSELIISSSTAGSNKKFKISVDDSGAITATEVAN